MTKSKGFTMIELLMVILVIAILAAMGISQFTNFAQDAKNSALKTNLQLIRRGVSNMNGMIRVRCGWLSTNFPDIATLKVNDITLGGVGPPCTSAQVPQVSDTAFVQGVIPPNPWEVNQPANGTNETIDQCTGTGCTDRSTECIGGGARSNASVGWCYDSATGQVWANTSNNDGLGTVTGSEHSF